VGTYRGALPPFSGSSFVLPLPRREGEVERWWWEWFNTKVEHLFVEFHTLASPDRSRPLREGGDSNSALHVSRLVRFSQLSHLPSVNLI